MNKRIFYLVVPFGVACDAKSGADLSQDEPPTCDAVVESTWPADGTTDAYYRDRIEFHLSGPDQYATVIAPVDGDQSFENDGKTVVFTPSEPLEPDTEYELGLDFCQGEPTLSFSTSVLGQPLEVPSDLIGATFVLDPTEARFSETGGVGKVLAHLYGRPFLLQFIDFEDGVADVRLAVGIDGGAPYIQDECYRTLDLFGVDLSNDADFVFAEEEVEIDFYTSAMSFFNVHAGGTVSPVLDWFGGGRFSALVEIDPMAESLGFDSREDVCDLAYAMGQDCVPCPSEDGTLCLQIDGDRLNGGAVDLELIEVFERNAAPGCGPEETDMMRIAP